MKTFSNMRFKLSSLQAQELHSNENILLQTLGFEVAIDHPHTHVVRCCQLVKGVFPLPSFLLS